MKGKKRKKKGCEGMRGKKMFPIFHTVQLRSGCDDTFSSRIYEIILIRFFFWLFAKIAMQWAAFLKGHSSFP